MCFYLNIMQFFLNKLKNFQIFQIFTISFDFFFLKIVKTKAEWQVISTAELKNENKRCKCER